MNSSTSNKLDKKTFKKWLKWLLIILIIFIIGIFIYNKFKPKNEAPDYITAPVTVGDIENSVMASGKVKALNTVDVGAQVSGEVVKLYVDVGDEVKKGDLIAQIDQVTQKNNLSNQQASLQQSRAGVESAKADLYSSEASLESAVADLASRKAELNQAQNDLARLKPLLDINAISQKEYDAALTNVETAKSRVASANAAIKKAKATMINAQSNIIKNQADLQKAQTNLNTADQNLRYTTIRAPIDGTVVSVTTEQGSTVNANQSAPTIVTLADLSTVRINAQISEADVINVAPGMPVYFNTIGNPDKKYDAVLTAIEPAPEKISATSSTDAAIYYVGYVEVPNLQRRFRIDMTAQVYIVINKAKDALLIPSNALIKGIPPKKVVNTNAGATHKSTSQNLSDNPAKKRKSTNQSQYYVRVLLDDGTVENRVVKVGINNRVNAQILSGVKKGENIIINDGEKKQGNNERRSRRPKI